MPPYFLRCRSGFFLTCDDAACTRAPTLRTAFTSGQCLPAKYGSRSVAFMCGAGGSVSDEEVAAALGGVQLRPAPAGLHGASGAAAVEASGVVVVGAAAAAWAAGGVGGRF